MWKAGCPNFVNPGRNYSKAHISQNKQRKSVPKQKPVTILEFCILIWNILFCEEKKLVNMKNLAKITNKGEKNPKKAEEQVHFMISFLDTTFVSLACTHLNTAYVLLPLQIRGKEIFLNTTFEHNGQKFTLLNC